MKKVLMILLTICSFVVYTSCAGFQNKTVNYDIDKYGVKERCSVSYGYTGLCTVVVTAESEGYIKYRGCIPFLRYGTVSFVKVNGDLKLRYSTKEEYQVIGKNETNYYDISVDEDKIILSEIG